MSAALQPIAAALLDAFAPLDRALRDPAAFRTLLRNLGWEKTFADDVLGGPPLTGIAADVAEALQSGARILTEIEDAADRDPLVDELFDVIDSLQGIVRGLQDLEGLPDSLDDPDLWAGLALDLPEYLIVRYLERYQPVVYGLLRLAGVIEDDGTALEPENGDRRPYVRHVIVWDNLVALVGDPPGHLQRLYGWEAGGTPFDHARLLDELATFMALAGGRAERLALRDTIATPFYGSSAPPADARELALPVLRGRIDGAPAEQGVLLAPVPERPGRAVDGLYVANLAWGSATGSLELGDDWSLEVIGALDATGVVGAHVRPGALTWDSVPSDGRLELALVGAPDQPWLLLGAPGGVRLEVGGLRLALAFTGGTTPDVALEARTLPTATRGGIAFTIDPGSGDSFMGSLIPEPVEADLDLDVAWSARHGFTISGGGGLELIVPVDKTLGPITLESIHLALAGDSEGASLALGITAAALLPPFSARVDDVGLALVVRSGAADGIAGGLELSAALKPPEGVGLGVDIAGVVSGGGYVAHEPGSGRYVGALALDFVALGLDAVVIVDTELPGDPDGFALFASLSLTFPSIPLGFGFFLSGVGGLVCVNRTLESEALAAGLKSGAIDAILFPSDPVNDAALIASQLDSWFPVAPGSAVFGVAATITWGTPKTIVTGELGVALSFPDLEIVVMGSVKMVLPDDEVALLELHMDTIGAIDVSEQTFLVAASLYDSTLLDTISLSGDMAMYARLGDDPYFLLSVGGYHPAFDPPAGVPAAVTDLDRMRVEVTLSDNVWYALESYVAVTSNTLQFGANASLEMSMRFLRVTYSATADVGFDVLLVLTPFAFVADFHASVAITAGSHDRELTSISLTAHLEGPKPWFATGTASFDFFGINVPFHVEVGGPAVPQIPARQDVVSLVVTALGDPSAWRGVTPAGADAGAVLPAVDEPDDDDDDATAPLPVRPDAELEAVQTLAPLERTLEHYGIYEIIGADRLEITSVGVGTKEQAWETVADWFAPAQYDDMGRSEKLSAPSYEEMTAGVRFGAASVTFGSASRTVVPSPEVKILEEQTTVDLGIQVFRGDLVVRYGTGPVLGTRSVSSTRFTVGSPTYSLVDATTGSAAGPTGSYHDALVARHAAIAADPAARAAVRVAPTHAVLA
jgi:hypothetical protein